MGKSSNHFNPTFRLNEKWAKVQGFKYGGMLLLIVRLRDLHPNKLFIAVRIRKGVFNKRNSMFIKIINIFAVRDSFGEEGQ